MNDTLNNTLSSKQTPFRASIVKTRKKKAHKLVPKLKDMSKTISKGEAYKNVLSKKARRLTKKAKGLSTKPRHTFNPTKAPTRLTTRMKKMVNKELWNTTHDVVQVDSDDMSDDEERIVDSGNAKANRTALNRSTLLNTTLSNHKLSAAHNPISRDNQSVNKSKGIFNKLRNMISDSDSE